MSNVRAVADPVVRLAIAVTEAPWTVESELAPALAEHVVLQASLFGHLNRIADAVDVPADYREIQQRWDNTHAIRTLCGLVALAGYILAVLAR